MAACGVPKEIEAIDQDVATSNMRREPAARAFRPNGDYGMYVPVVLSADGRSVSHRPETNEIDASMAPLPLGGNWYLDPGGINAATVFVDWTYAEYGHLPATPTDAEILAHLIPGAGIAEIVELPVGRMAVRHNPDLAIRTVAERIDSCRRIYPVK